MVRILGHGVRSCQHDNESPPGARRDVIGL